ncbi:hypothetical protein [Anaeromusa acidaminophila]|nr:hypothetical protein [Anaeromusa acidaminophila]
MPVKKKHSRRRVLFSFTGNYPKLSKAAQRRETEQEVPDGTSCT